MESGEEGEGEFIRKRKEEAEQTTGKKGVDGGGKEMNSQRPVLNSKN